jgi:hypothetical protein
MTTRHVGVGWLPPRSNDILNVTVVPETDPEILPSFILWHDSQDPSVALRGRMLTDPDSALPDCASTHENVSGPSPSDPLPVHVPVRFSDVAAGVDGVAAILEGAGACEGLPAQPWKSHPAARLAHTAAPQRPVQCVTTSMIRPRSATRHLRSPGVTAESPTKSQSSSYGRACEYSSLASGQYLL